MHLDSQIAAIMAEAKDWQALRDQSGEARLDVYLDLKSPHAYLAVRPSLEIARDFNVQVNFLPYTLSYIELGVSTSVEEDRLRRPSTPAADRKARMYYAAAREYSALQSLPFRTPQRLLDSANAHRAFLFAKRQGLEIPFAMWVYLHGWGSGWRNFELESSADLEAACRQVGVDVTDFHAFIDDDGEGAKSLADIMTSAEASGLVGTPHFVFYDRVHQRHQGLFGREHLALIRGKFLDYELAKHPNVVADFPHNWKGPAPD